MERFPDIRFQGELRPSQTEVVEIAREQLADGQRRLHIVAPPGSGKTVLGLYLWAECVKLPAVVFSPNSAIQMQWAARTDLFRTSNGDAVHPHTSTDPQTPGLLTSLTYQSVTLPRRGGSDLVRQARELWVSALIENDQAETPEEAADWIDDLQQNNPEYFGSRLADYQKKIRDDMAVGGEALETLHRSALETLHRLKDSRVGLVILDECHHLLGHWGRVLADADELLATPILVGLTATPPSTKGKPTQDVERYEQFFGPIDYEVPVPAVVKDGFLAPYQDLAYFVRPTAEELHYIANTDDALTALVRELCEPRTSSEDSAESSSAEDPPRTGTLPDWLDSVLANLQLGTTRLSEWSELERRDPVFADNARIFLQVIGRPLPQGVPGLPLPSGIETADGYPSEMSILVPVLDRYIRHGLRRSPHEPDQTIAEQAIKSLRALGVQVTETGTQDCASPVARVMAYSRSKAEALLPILDSERKVLGEAIRAVVITDFEKTSAVAAEVGHLMDEECGGAIAAFKQLLRDERTDGLDPILITGSTVLVDDDLAESFVQSAKQWLADNEADVKLEYHDHDGFKQVEGKGSDWCPRLYIRLVTELFQQGLTRCLVGTRGLLGEGWDANRINVLVDLTAVTTSMTVNQLRGRSIRLDPEWSAKVANNWDVVCLAPEFRKGLDDYRRFSHKHHHTYGVCEDGAIEKGPGHVHAAFTELKPESVEGAAGALNEEMLRRVGDREAARKLWRIGEPYEGSPVLTTEVSAAGGGGFPPVGNKSEPWSNESLAGAIGKAVLLSLIELKLVSGRLNNKVMVGSRAGGYVRVFLEDAEPEEAELFNESLREVLGPLDDPRYVIPREVDDLRETLLSRILPGIIGRYFVKYDRRLAMLHMVPRVLAKNKQSAELFQKHWNIHVSPGEVLFARRGRGEDLVREAKQEGLVSSAHVHAKEVFMAGATSG